MTKILCIGNSFSDDSTAYLHQMADLSGIDVMVVSLYIGGCSLKTHWENVCSGEPLYTYKVNGLDEGPSVSIQEALAREDWDIVTLQQYSGHSGLLETYKPYMTDLAQYVKERVPEAKLMVHQTWAYEVDADHEAFAFYNSSQEDMYEAVIQTYQAVSQMLDAPMIPFGQVVQAIRQNPLFDYKTTGKSLCRDGYHMDFLYGRYALAATWLKAVLGGDIDGNPFHPNLESGEIMSQAEIAVIKACVNAVVSG